MPNGGVLDKHLLQSILNTNRALEWIKNFVLKNARPDGHFLVRETHIQDLHTLCMKDLLESAGSYRKVALENLGIHYPPPAEEIPQHMRDFVGQINEQWKYRSVIWIGAFALWRLNWIHPFVDGNGRTSRLFSYFLMNMKAGHLFAGKAGYLVPEFLGGVMRDKYMKALKIADQKDLSPMENLLLETLNAQLSSAFDTK